MSRLRQALGVLTATLLFPVVISAQNPPIGCIGDDGFNLPWCTPVTNVNLPQFPNFLIGGDYCCIRDCDIEANFPVRITTNHIPIFCDLALIQIVVHPASPGAPGYMGTLIAKYARTWTEPVTDPTGVIIERQVWRWLVNGNLTVWQSASTPCPYPPHVNPNFGTFSNVHFTGSVDYACDPVAGTIAVVDQIAINLNHEVGCISHNAFSSSPPVAANAAHHDRSYHLFGPSGFTCTPIQEPIGMAHFEAVRSTRFPGNYVCLGEAPVIDGIIDTIGADCLCQPGLIGPFDYKHQVLKGIIDCGGVQNSYQNFPLNFPPVLPFPTGFTAHPLGLWTNPPDTFPGTRELTTYFGFLLFFDDCNPNDFPVKVVTGVGTTTNAGGFLFGGQLPGAHSRVFIDLEDMLLPNSMFGSFALGWGTTFLSKVVWNLNIG